ncbi:hypothetical protein HDV03_003469 [Kappamyces sp. JEL0829]|nr:hypothetical protein HDV03_003469 [Kappamyces sp. JEL0829]
MRLRLCLSVLLPVAESYVFMESQWIHSADCSRGSRWPPDSIMTFAADYPNADISDSWPWMFWFYRLFDELPYCGYAPVSFGPDEDCCASSIDPLFYTAGYQSGSWHDISTSDTLEAALQHVPVSAVGAQYCVLSDRGNNGTMTYQNMLVLASGECIEGWLQCFGNGSLLLYDPLASSSCDTAAEWIALEPATSVVSSAILGTVDGAMVTIAAGHSRPGWVAMSPSGLIVAEFKTPLEMFVLVFYVCSLLSLLGAFLYNLVTFIKRRKSLLVLCMISQSLWIIYVSLTIAVSYTVYDSEAGNWAWTMYNGFLGLSGLSSTLVSASVVIGFMEWGRKWQAIALYSFLVFVNLVTLGPEYTICIYYWDLARIPSNFFDWFNTGQLVFAIFMFLFDLVPAAIMLSRILHNAHIPVSQWATALYRANKFILLYLVGDVLMLGVFVATWQIMFYSNLLGDDRIFNEMWCIYSLAESIHALFVCLLSQSFGSIFLHFQSKKNKLQFSESAPDSPDASQSGPQPRSLHFSFGAGIADVTTAETATRVIRSLH